MNIKYVEFLLLMLCYGSFFDIFSYQVLKAFENKDCTLTFLQDSAGERWVLKQIKSNRAEEQLLLVLDALGNTLAESVGVRVNHVEIVSPTAVMIGKEAGNPATLHTFVAGGDLENSEKYHQLDIHQRMRIPGSDLYQNYGPLKPERTGLTQEIITNMSLHPDLSPLVAVDTFTNNSDRSCPNIFYDEKSDTFWGIDMAAVYNKNLCKEACRQIQSFVKNRIVFSAGELRALESYCATLEKLLEKYPSYQTIEELFVKLTKQAGFYPGSPLYTTAVEQRISFHCHVMSESFEDALNLAQLVRELLALSQNEK